MAGMHATPITICSRTIGTQPLTSAGEIRGSTGDDEQTIKVTPKKNNKTGPIKLKKQAPKHTQPGNWMDGAFVEGTHSHPELKPGAPLHTHLTLYI